MRLLNIKKHDVVLKLYIDIFTYTHVKIHTLKIFVENK